MHVSCIAQLSCHDMVYLLPSLIQMAKWKAIKRRWQMQTSEIDVFEIVMASVVGRDSLDLRVITSPVLGTR